MLKRLLFEEKGEDLVEYALLIALIALVVIATNVLPGIGNAVSAVYQEIIDKLALP